MINFCLAFSLLHSNDFGPVAVQRVVLEKFTAGEIDTAGQVVDFFEKVTQINADR